MKQWHKGNLFVGVLKRKQMLLKKNIISIEKELTKLADDIADKRQEYHLIAAEITDLIPYGIFTQIEIGHKFRQQAVFMNKQQFIVHHLHILEDKQAVQLENLKNCYREMQLLDKKHYKLTYYIKVQRNKYLLQQHLNTENDIGELATYAKNHTINTY